MRKKFRLPSPAMTVACISLAVALSGASYAAITLPKNSVGTKQIRNNAVKSNKIAANAVKGVDVDEASLGTVPSAASAANAAAIADNTVNSAKVVDDSLGGADVNESNLGTVPNADTVDNIHMATFGFSGEAGAGPTEILNVGGLVLTAECNGAGVLFLTADSTANNALFRAFGINANAADVDFDAADAPLNFGENNQQGTFTYTRPFVTFINPGATVTGTWVAEEDAFNGTDCVVRGIAQASTPGGFAIIFP